MMENNILYIYIYIYNMNYFEKYNKYKIKNLKLQIGGNETSQKVINDNLKHLILPVFDKDIGEYFTNIINKFYIDADFKDHDKISDFISGFSQNLGNSPSMYSEKSRLEREGTLTTSIISTYSLGQAPIHIIGNYASDAALIGELDVNMLKWFIDLYIPFKKFLFFEKIEGFNNFYSSDKKLPFIENLKKLDYMNIFNKINGYSLLFINITNIPYTFFYILYKIIDQIDKGTKLFNAIKANESIKHDLKKYKVIYNLSGNMSLFDNINEHNKSFYLFYKNWNREVDHIDLINNYIQTISENYSDDINLFIIYYYTHINDLNNILEGEYIHHLGIAYLRLKIINEKYDYIHNLETDDAIIKIRGLISYKEETRKNDREITQNILKFDKILDQITFMINKFCQDEIHKYIDVCLKNFRTITSEIVSSAESEHSIKGHEAIRGVDDAS